MRVSTGARPRQRGRVDKESTDFAGLSAGAVTRRSAIAVLAGWSVLSTARAMRVDEVKLPPAPSGPAPSLGALAEKSGLTFGASIGRKALEDKAYQQLYLDHARILTSDLALKMLILRPDQGPPRYQEADRLVEFAERNKMAFRGHTLIWNENNPEWLKALGPNEVGAWLDRHIDETVGRYAGRMHSWDVVNEPFWPDHKAPGWFRKGPWFNALGPAYIGRALRRASAADPKAKLVINEAFTERGDGLGKAVRRELLRLIDDLQHAGVPLHAIGLEAHLQPQFAEDDTGFLIFLDQIAQRGLDIYISELDVDDVGLPDNAAQRDQVIADRVYAFLSRALTCPAVKVLECWQLSDKYSWFADPSMANRRGSGGVSRPLPFDRAMNRKPMFEAIARVLSSRTA
jgi:endo-1,4-beta-xylanase